MSGSGVLGVGKRVVSGSVTMLGGGVWVLGGNVGLGAMLVLDLAVLLALVIFGCNFVFWVVCGE